MSREHSMATSDDDEFARRQAIYEASKSDSCPHCGILLAKTRFGSGRHSDGVFCSLDCLATFHDDYYLQRRSWGNPNSN